MKWFKWIFFVLIILIIVAFFMLPRLNNFQVDGETRLTGITKPVKAIRDKKGMAYLFGEDLYDVIKAQGYVTAQDRLFQMHIFRVLIRGQLSESFGEKARESDITYRTLGFYRAAEKHERILDKDTQAFFQAYADGVNEYILNGKDTWPLELSLVGFEPDLWKVADSLAIMYFLGWGSAANMSMEIMAQMLIDKVGYEKFMTIFPVNINPDEPSLTSMIPSLKKEKAEGNYAQLNFIEDSKMRSMVSNGFGPIRLGSNNWAVDATKSPNGKPIVASDPHLATNMLPTTFYPVGMFTPEFRAVGVTVPGIPGLTLGRNEYIAIGVTNSYGDAQDLYVETIDPNNPANYLEGKK
ncbi:MAG: penicillin acylase family protein [Desulfobacteraceae bacterium]|nr:penicillin acylase family protein [Desulfobacteraceae bacterium]